MIKNDIATDNRVEEVPRRLRFAESFLAHLADDLEAMAAAGERLASAADPNGVPLAVVRLPIEPEDGGDR